MKIASQFLQLQDLDLIESHHENDDTVRWRVSMPFASAFPAFVGIEPDDLSAVYFELDGGCHLGRHTDSAEEALLVLEGAVEVEIDGETAEYGADGMVLVPAMAPHSVKNVGSEPARLLGFFADAAVTSTFEQVVQPMGGRTFGPDAPDAANRSLGAP